MTAREPNATTKFSVRARVRSFRFAVAGLAHMVQHEHNARVHAVATLATILVSFWLRISLSDWRWIVLAIALVWICEAINTALEAICDRFSPEPNDAVRIAKDVAAGAVLVSALGAILAGTLTLWPYAAVLMTPR